MFSGLLIILVPLIVGYLIPLRQQAALKVINQLLSWMVYLILFFMGISLAFLDNLASNLLAILHYSAVSITVILLCNIAALMWLERGLPWRNHHHQEKLPSRIAMALESLKLCGVVVIGFAIGLSGLAFLQHATEASEYTLILLLFLVGIQLRNNGMTLKQIVLNRRGMIVAVVVVVSSLIGGLINAFILDLPINTALAMASGFGWYSLSGILLTESFGPVIGSAAPAAALRFFSQGGLTSTGTCSASAWSVAMGRSWALLTSCCSQRHTVELSQGCSSARAGPTSGSSWRTSPRPKAV